MSELPPPPEPLTGLPGSWPPPGAGGPEGFGGAGTWFGLDPADEQGRATPVPGSGDQRGRLWGTATVVATAVVAFVVGLVAVALATVVLSAGDPSERAATADPPSTVETDAPTGPVDRNHGPGEPVAHEFDYFGSVGTCIAAVSYDDVPCAQEHIGEVYARIPLMDAAYPGEAELRARAKECDRRFTDVAGETSTALGREVFASYPDESAWADDLHEIICVAFSSAKTTGTLAGG